MPLITVQVPPGLMMNGTYYDAKNQWRNANRVRWHHGTLRPIGGWQQVADYQDVNLPAITATSDTSTARDGFSWEANDGSRYRVFGLNDALSVWAPDDTVSDITPAGFVGSANLPTVSTGYGRWLYGRGAYGTRRPVNPIEVPSIWRWKFNTWGEDLIAGPAAPAFAGTLYTWDVSAGTATPATAIAGAPLDLTNFVVTDQRIVMAIGSSNEARLVRWSDREDYSEWTPTQLNYAGDYFLQGNGKLLTIDKIQDQILILSETDAHVARWLGAPLVYGFNRVGADCGPINSSVVYAADRFAMWPGRRSFWMYDGTLRQVECPIMDYINSTLSKSRVATAYVVGVPQYTEIWWFYQSTATDTDDVDTYVAYDYSDNTWTVGKLDRTCGISGEVTVNPYLVSTDTQYIFEHELDNIVVEDAWGETGPLELGQGDRNMAVRYIFPDTKTSGNVSYTLYGQDQVTDTRYEYGPYAFDSPIATRALGRSISMKVIGSASAKWQVGGKTRFDVAPIGTGMR